MLELVEHDNGVMTLRSPRLSACGVVHAFSTRVGGISPRPYTSLNLAAPLKGDDTDANTHIAENFRRVREVLRVPRCVRIETRQVHGAEVWCPPVKPLPISAAPKCDGVVSNTATHLLVCRTADCVPVLLATQDGRTVGCAHAGWRGMVAGVIGQTVARLAALADVEPARLVAAIGPCIGVDAYEVGDEVAQAFETAGLSEGVIRDGLRGQSPYQGCFRGRPHIDLQACAKIQLEDAGVQQIDGNACCTHRDEALFFSYRRDGSRTGRMAALITPVPARDDPLRSSVWHHELPFDQT